MYICNHDVCPTLFGNSKQNVSESSINQTWKQIQNQTYRLSHAKSWYSWQKISQKKLIMMENMQHITQMFCQIIWKIIKLLSNYTC